MKDVAAYAGVSQPTVSNVLNGVPNVSEASRMQVWKAVKELGYLPNQAARILKANCSKTIGVVVPDISSGYYTEIVEHIEAALRQSGYLIYLCNTSYESQLENEYLSQLLKYRVDGVLICYGVIQDVIYHRLQEASVPFVVLDGQIQDQFPEILTVDNNNYLGSELAIEHLHQMGCRNICYASEPLYNEVLKNRYAGYKKAMEKRNLPVEKDMVFIAHKQYRRVEMGFDIGTNILLNPSIDAVYASSDYIAVGILKRLEKGGKKVPRDLLVVGYDDVLISELVSPTLSTVFQPKKDIAEQAVRMLLQSIAQKEVEEPHIMLSPHLVVRESSVKF